MNRFACNPMDRYQVTLFGPTLEESIGRDHPVRLYDEILAQCQWSSWENQFGVRIVPDAHCLSSASTARNFRELFTANNTNNYAKLWTTGWLRRPGSKYIDSVTGSPRHLLPSSR